MEENVSSIIDCLQSQILKYMANYDRYKKWSSIRQIITSTIATAVYQYIEIKSVNTEMKSVKTTLNFLTDLNSTSGYGIDIDRQTDSYANRQTDVQTDRQ